MADIVDKATRSRMMSGIRGKNTRPEIIVRKALFSMGYRFRLHRKDLPGKPDIVLPKKNTAIFINGCFWHAHEGCRYAKSAMLNLEKNLKTAAGASLPYGSVSSDPQRKSE